jgi:hypothetical protein
VLCGQKVVTAFHLPKAQPKTGNRPAFGKFFPAPPSRGSVLCRQKVVTALHLPKAQPKNVQRYDLFSGAFSTTEPVVENHVGQSAEVNSKKNGLQSSLCSPPFIW